MHRNNANIIIAYRARIKIFPFLKRNSDPSSFKNRRKDLFTSKNIHGRKRKLCMVSHNIVILIARVERNCHRTNENSLMIYHELNCDEHMDNKL